MPIIPNTTDLLAEINALAKRVAVLENTNPLLHSAITDGVFQVVDSGGNVSFEAGTLPARGNSPAQVGARANNAGVPIWDSLGVLGLPKLLAEVIQTSAVQGTNTSFADVSGLVTPTFTLSRSSTVVTFAMGRFAAEAIGSGNIAFLGVRCGPNTTTGAPAEVDAQAARLFVPYCIFFRTVLAAGSYTAALQAQTSLSGGGNQWDVAYGSIDVWQFGG